MEGFKRLGAAAREAAKEIEALCDMLELAKRHSGVGRQKWQGFKRGRKRVPKGRQ